VAGWAPFTVFVAVLTVLLLLLSRQSQQLIEQLETSDSRQELAGEEHPTSDTNHVTESRANETAETDADKPRRESGDSVQPEAGGTDRELSQPEKQEPLPADYELTPKALLLNVGVTQGLVLVLILAAAWYFSIPAEAFGVTGEPMSTGVPAITAGVLFGVVLWIGNELSTTVADAVGAAYDETVRELLAADSPGGAIALFGVVLPIIAVAEELLFRAALIGVPAAGFDISPWLLAVVASIAFALGHGAQGRVGIVVTGLLGFVLAAGYIISGSLLLVIVAHYVINALEFLLHEYLDIEGMVPGRFVGDY